MDAVAITLDIDWAPDFVIEWCATRLISANVKTTWFVTHDCEALKLLRSRPDLFELGIHPNFNDLLSGVAERDEDADSRVRCLLDIVPEARGVRSHSLIQSSYLSLLYKRFGLAYEANLLIPDLASPRALLPCCLGSGPVRVPSIWEDDVNMWRLASGHAKGWSLTAELGTSGLRVFNFHPLHVYLNTFDLDHWERVKASCSPLTNATLDQITPFRCDGDGPRAAFGELVDHIRQYPKANRKLIELVDDAIVSPCASNKCP